jgi:hypothetical protein
LLAIDGRGSLRNAAGIVRIFLDFSGKLVVNYYKSTYKEKEANLSDEIPQRVDRSGFSAADDHGFGRSGHHAGSSQKTGAGPGSPNARLDGQLQLRHSHSGPLESSKSNAPF